MFSLATVMMVACTPKKDSARTVGVTRAADAAGIVNGTAGVIANTCSQNQFPIGTIYDSGTAQVSLYNSGTYEDRVKGLLSATVNPQEVGQISSAQWETTGVRFQGVIKLDQNGNVQLAQSKILIKVYDSFVLQQNAQPIPVSIEAASEGRFDMQTGTGYVVFKDQYGEIRLDGRFDAQNFSGQISYKNYVSFDNQTPSQGQLGQFLIARCGIIQ